MFSAACRTTQVVDTPQADTFQRIIAGDGADQKPLFLAGGTGGICDNLATKEDLQKCIQGFSSRWKKYCDDEHDCRHFTDDFCYEVSRKATGMCTGYGFGCDNPKIGHGVVLIRLGKQENPPYTYCLAEPQANEVLYCFESPDFIPPDRKLNLADDVKRELDEALRKRYDWYAKCAESDKWDYLVDPNQTLDDLGDKQCCLCGFPDLNNPGKPLLEKVVGPEKLTAQGGACESIAPSFWGA